MSKELTGMLHLKLEPVGVFFGNTSIQCDFDASPSRRNCVVPLLAAAANGRTISMNEDSCNCPGGATGCCFGDGFTRKNPKRDSAERKGEKTGNFPLREETLSSTG